MSDKNPKFNREAFKKAIAFVESSGGKNLDNPNSSAAGRYHFLYRYIKNDPDMKGITKRQFMANPELQELIMDKAIDGTLKGYPSYEKKAYELKGKYDTNLRVEEIAALTHFLGGSGVEKYMANRGNFEVPGKNASTQEYITRFNEGLGTVPGFQENPLMKSKTTVENDGLFAPEALGQQLPDGSYNVGEPTIPTDQIYVNEFADGGSMGPGDEDKKKEKPVESGVLTKAVRNVLPLPNNASQMIAGMVNSDSRFGTGDANAFVNEHLYNSVRNAIKRTGKNRGGTEYEDYKSPGLAGDINSLGASGANALLGSLFSPEFEAATTFGRVSYDYDPKTGQVKIYDNYDFSKTPGKKNAYSKIRQKAGELSDGRLDGGPNLIGEFNMNDESNIGLMDLLLNPIESMDIRYDQIQNYTDRVYKNAKELGSKIYEKGSEILDKINPFEFGGDMITSGEEELIEFEGGGTHEENSLGGIPQGIGANGKLNTVEEDETKYSFDDGDYVFSNRIAL